jgi:hypothetical protein
MREIKIDGLGGGYDTIVIEGEELAYVSESDSFWSPTCSSKLWLYKTISGKYVVVEEHSRRKRYYKLRNGVYYRPDRRKNLKYIEITESIFDSIFDFNDSEKDIEEVKKDYKIYKNEEDLIKELSTSAWDLQRKLLKKAGFKLKPECKDKKRESGVVVIE